MLDKPGKLDRDEWAAVRQHAQFTESILSRIGAFAELARVAAAHHERLDGGGYPRGLAADQITLETRIITTADIFDALSAERPYRAAMPIAEDARNDGGRRSAPRSTRCCFEALKQVVQAGTR